LSFYDLDNDSSQLQLFNNINILILKCCCADGESHLLRSQNSGQLIKPRISKSTAGGRSFFFLAPKQSEKNSPNMVREADTLCQFESRL